MTSFLVCSVGQRKKMRTPAFAIDEDPYECSTRLVFPAGQPNGGQRHRPDTTASVAWRGLSGLAPPATLLWLPALAAVSVLPLPALAHVKWFEPYDVSAPPAPLNSVLTDHFLLVFAGFVALLVGSFLLDRVVAAQAGSLSAPGRYAHLEQHIMRAGTGAFFMALFATGGVILTPELRTDADWSSWLALGIAVSMLSERTCVLGGLGILALYGFGIAQYGVFHLADYPMFLGIAAYLALTSFASERLRSYRMLILHISICGTLMWGAVEKWAYPQWTFPLLAERPYLTFGLPPRDFMVVAGFIEFAFAFYMLTGLALLRFAILGLGAIFIAAIPDFGKVDAIGHLPILVSMVAMFMNGPTQLNLWLHKGADSVFRKARTVGTTFAATVFIFFATYYGLQHAEYPHDHQATLSAAPMLHHGG
jgi:hypothetical protein